MMEESVWKVGVVQGVREGPWRIPHKDESKQTYGLLHWASLHSGVQRCILRDVGQQNKAVQLAKQQGMKGIKEYHRRTPLWARKFLVYIGNKSNDVVCNRTFLQGLRHVPEGEAAWAKRKVAMGWTFASEGQSSMNEKKFALFTTLFPGYFSSYRKVEITVAVYNAATNQDYFYEGGPWFDSFVKVCMDEVDFTNEAVNKFSDIWSNLHLIMRLVKMGTQGQL